MAFGSDSKDRYKSSVRKKKYLEIAEYLKKDILRGKYRVGEHIPTIRQLAEIYGVNPQTANKATAYLTSLGYLIPRQGSGSVVRLPETASVVEAERIVMLVDRSRSKLIDLESPSNYHCKDIYLSFLMHLSNHENRPGFLVYDKSAKMVDESFIEASKNIKGIVVQGSLPRCYFDFLAENNIPTVLINRVPARKDAGRFGAVIISVKAIYQMIDYLVSLGHSKILFAYSLELEESEILTKRFDAAKDALDQWGNEIEGVIEIFKYYPGSSESAKELKSKIEEGYSAAVGYNDVSALGLYTLLYKNKLNLPFDFSIVGFDDIFASKIASPPLTTIRVDRAAMVKKALSILSKISHNRGSVYVEEIIETELVIRKSVYIKK